jgi:hypothetical protein
VNNAEDAVIADEVPGVDGRAVLARIANQTCGVDGGNGAVCE